MRGKTILFLCITFVFLFTFPMVTIAQDDLAQTYASPDGKFSMSYPSGWTLNDEENVTGFRGDAGFLEVSFYDNNNSGYAPVTALELLEVNVGEDADLRATRGYSEPEELIIAGFPAVQSDSTTLNELHTVIDFGDGVLANVIGFATDLATSEPTFMAMMNSIQYGDGPQPIVEGPLDNVVAIRSANASQITPLMMLGDESVSVEAVAFNSDDRLLAIGSADGNVQLWDVATGETRFTLPGHTGGASSLAFGAGGYSLAVGTGSGEVWLWDTASGELSGTLQEHETAVTSVAFQADGFLIASGAADGSLKVWDMISASEQPALAEANDQTPIGSLAFSPDGTLLAAGDGSRLRLWDTATWTLQTELETEISDISCISFRPDGAALVYGGADPAVWVWDLTNSNQVLLEGHIGTVSALAFSPEGDLIASADAEAVRLWDAIAGAKLATLASPSDQGVNSVAFKPDGTLLASGGPLGGVVLWGTSAEGEAVQGSSAPETSEDTTTEETTTSTPDCTFTAPDDANLRSGPGTSFDRAGTLSAGQTVEVDGQTQGTDGITWYRLASGAWVRSDVVGTPTACANVPVVAG
jgi:WD40 repeat protein